MKCERCGKKKATQADTYLNEWQCDDCYSEVGRVTEDYQAEFIDWSALEGGKLRIGGLVL